MLTVQLCSCSKECVIIIFLKYHFDFVGMERKAVYDFIQTVTKYSRGVRSSALFEETKLSGNPFSMLTSLRGTENVYTQHRYTASEFRQIFFILVYCIQ